MRHRTVSFLAATLALVFGACASSTTGSPAGTPENPPPSAPSSPSAPPPEAPPSDAPAKDAPRDMRISALLPDAQKVVRVRGVVTEVLGLQLVPPKFIFNVRDESGTVMALINDKSDLSEGSKVEIIGIYKVIPAPRHGGPGPAPEESVLVVDRYLTLP